MTRPDPRSVLSPAELSALRAVGIDADEVFRRIEETFGDPEWFIPDDPHQPERRRFGRRRVRFGAEAKRALEESLRQAIRLRHRHIGTEHTLLGLLALPQPPLPNLLAAHGITYEQARQRVLAAVSVSSPR